MKLASIKKEFYDFMDFIMYDEVYYRWVVNVGATAMIASMIIQAGQ